jgi:hypothetical protein
MKILPTLPTAILLLLTGTLSTLCFAEDKTENKQPIKMITILGVETSRVSDALRNQIDIPEGVGLTISHIAENTGAANSDLQQYDILLKVDEQIIINQEQLSTYIRSKNPGDKVKVEILRKGKKQTLSVELSEREAPRNQRFGPDWTIPLPDKPPFGNWNFDFNSEDFQKRMEEFSEHAAEMGNKAMQFIPQIMIERDEPDGSKRVTSIGRGPHRIVISKDDLVAKVETTDGKKQFQVSRKKEGKDEEILYEGEEPSGDALGKLPEEARELINRLKDSEGLPWKNLEGIKNENIRVIINTGEEEAKLIDEHAREGA